MLCFFFNSIAWSHFNPDAPVDVTSGLYEVMERNRAGYGFLNSSSEAEADSIFQTPCKKLNHLDLNNCLSEGSELEEAYLLAKNNMEVALTNMAREKLFEYLMLQQISLNPSSSLPQIPNCLLDSEEIKKITVELEKIKSLDELKLNNHLLSLNRKVKSLLSKTREERTQAENETLKKLKKKILLSIKLRSTKASMDKKKIAQALLLDKQLASAQMSECQNKSNSDLVLKCQSIKKNRERIRGSFPLIFGQNLAELDSLQNAKEIFDMDKRTRLSKSLGLLICEKTPRDRFEISIQKMIGRFGTYDSSSGGDFIIKKSSEICVESEKDLVYIRRGKSIIEESISNDMGFSHLVSEDNGGKFNEAFFEAKNSFELPSPTTDSLLGEYFLEFHEAYEGLKKNLLKESQENLNSLCTEFNLEKISSRYPHVLRQTVLDQTSSAERDALKQVLCSKNIMSSFQKNEQTLSCFGVSGDPHSSEGMRISRDKHGFPFQNSMNYKIKKNSDGNLEIIAKINYVFIPDPSIDPDHEQYQGNNNVPVEKRKSIEEQRRDFDRQVSHWTRRTSEFFNKSAKEISAPKIKFKIESCKTCSQDEKPRVKVGTCYRKDEPKSFSSDFPGESYNSHKCYFKNGVKLFADWQNAGNFTTDMNEGAIIHETGHNLGLSDEYVADYYPAHPIGEYGDELNDKGELQCSSVMGNSAAGCIKIYPRHLLELIRPLEACSP